MDPSSPNATHVSLPFTDRKLPATARVLGPAPAAEPVRVSLIVKRKQPLDLASLHGRHLSREGFSSRYAADPAAFAQLRAFASRYGLSVDEAASRLDRRTLVLDGTAQQVQQAFQTESAAANNFARLRRRGAGPSIFESAPSSIAFSRTPRAPKKPEAGQVGRLPESTDLSLAGKRRVSRLHTRQTTAPRRRPPAGMHAQDSARPSEILCWQSSKS